MSAHRTDVLDRAGAMRAGRVDAFGISSWTVTDADPAGVDVRCIHELSRMHHWCVYALAAHLDPTHRDVWCTHMVREVQHFMERWPAETGTHWAFPMGTGLRLHSMLVAWDWMRQSGWHDANAERVVAAAAMDHARSVWARRESRGGLSTSHYAANLLGLLAAGRIIAGASEADEWLREASVELEREVHRQILNDGMSNEASTGYHRQIVDTFVQASALMTFSEPARTRLGRAVATLQRVEGAGMPLIGDNDDGLAMKLTGFVPDTSYLVDVAQRTLNVQPEIPQSAVPSITRWEAFGLVLAHAGPLSMTVRNGPVGQFGKGGHAHNDMNSLTVRVADEWFIVDPGTSTYTADPAQRDAERSVHAHATMWCAGAEPRTIVTGADGLFWLLEEGHASMAVDGDRVRSSFTAHGVRHERVVEMAHDRVNVHDVLTGCAGRGLLSIPFAPHVRVDLGAGRALVRGRAHALEITWDAGDAYLDEGAVAERFGSRVGAPVLRIRAEQCRWTVRVLAEAPSLSSQP
jgi:hypothetical protein